MLDHMHAQFKPSLSFLVELKDILSGEVWVSGYTGGTGQLYNPLSSLLYDFLEPFSLRGITRKQKKIDSISIARTLKIQCSED